MMHAAPLLCALLVCALTAVLAALFAQGNVLMLGLLGGVGAFAAAFTYRGIQRHMAGRDEQK